MSGKFGGGGAKCTICTKTVYPAETVQHEKKPYHVDCFRCSVETCNKKMENASKAQAYDSKLYCQQCFKNGGFAQKQSKVVWTKKAPAEGGSATASKFGGGGNPCNICSKTVYPAETVQYEKKVYHPSCFACSKCEVGLKASGAAQFEGALFCTKCFKDGGYSQKQAATGATKSTTSTNSAIASKFGGGGNPCSVCQKTVYTAEAVSFEKRIYHAECLACVTCDKKITPSGAALFEDKVYCKKCFAAGGYTQKQAATAKQSHKPSGGTTSAKFSKFGGGGDKCVRCDKTVYPAETVSYEKNKFHSDCFTCKKCEKKLTPSSTEGQKKDDGTVDIYCKKCWGEEGLNRAKLNPVAAP